MIATRPLLAAILAVGLLLLPTASRSATLRVGEARLAGIITDAAVDEVSGLAASRRHPGILWAHNDSGNTAEIHALDRSAQRRASVAISNVRNIDWEDIAAFRDAGRDWLLIADVGDNGGIRQELQLHIVPEPESLEDGSIEAVRTIRFVWPDGARDCEAVAVDIAERAIYLVSKKRVPPELFRLPLDGDSSAAPLVAEKVGAIQHISQPSARDLSRNPVYGRYRAQITGMDISPNGRMLAVLNYLQARIYIRAPGEPWSEAVRRPPVDAPFPWVAQAEAIAFSAEGDALWVGSEILPAPLLEIPLSAD